MNNHQQQHAQKTASSGPGNADCCGGAPKADATACCVADEQAKAAGEAGCGCNAPEAKPAKPSSCCG